MNSLIGHHKPNKLANPTCCLRPENGRRIVGNTMDRAKLPPLANGSRGPGGYQGNRPEAFRRAAPRGITAAADNAPAAFPESARGIPEASHYAAFSRLADCPDPAPRFVVQCDSRGSPAWVGAVPQGTMRFNTNAARSAYASHRCQGASNSEALLPVRCQDGPEAGEFLTKPLLLLKHTGNAQLVPNPLLRPLQVRQARPGDTDVGGQHSAAT
jgi:hypothetical protein